MSSMQFTAHNIALPDGSRTIPDAPLLSELEQCRAFLRTIEAAFPNRNPETIRIVDLGCLEGGYSFEFARQGYQVLGIEVRSENIAKCLSIAEKLQLPNLEFVCDDVLNIARYGEFDVIFCCGLLYHLENPTSYLQLLGRHCRKLLIVHTHYATAKPGERCSRSPVDENSAIIGVKMTLRSLNNRCRRFFKSGSTDFGLTGLFLHEGKKGRWYYEYKPQESTASISKMLWTSYGNYRSFWPTKKALLQSIRESGFPLVFEQYDFLDDIDASNYIEDYSRSLFIGLKK